jgi:hypothetical protein
LRRSKEYGLGIAADLHPADSLNQISSARGIPKRFKPKPSRSSTTLAV